MYKKLLILFLLLLSGILFFSSVALADPANPSNPFYPVLGYIDLPAGINAADVTINIYHKDQPVDFIYTTLNEDNNYILNVFQLYSEKDVDIVFEEVENYKIKLVHDDIDNYDVTADIYYVSDTQDQIVKAGNPIDIKFPSIKGQLIINFSLEDKEALEVTTNILPAGIVGQEYNAQVEAEGGIVPYSWEIASGDLPEGLIFNENGIISGTPTKMETKTLVFKVTDSQNNIAYSESIILTINDVENGPPVSVVAYIEGFYEKGNPVTCSIEFREAANSDDAASNQNVTLLGICSINILGDGAGNSSTWSMVPIKLTPEVGNQIFIVLKQSNHLSVMLKDGILEIKEVVNNNFDFTDNNLIYKTPLAVAEPLVQKFKNAIKWMVRGGDANADGKVELSDFDLLMQDWELGGKEATDFNGDNNSELSDFDIIMNNWEINAFIK